MTIEQLAAAVLDACDAEGVAHMLTGAFAFSVYGIPRSTKDVDVLTTSLLILPSPRSISNSSTCNAGKLEPNLYGLKM